MDITTTEATHINEIDNAHRAYAQAYYDPLFRCVRVMIRRNCLTLSRERRAYMRMLHEHCLSPAGLILTQGEITL